MIAETLCIKTDRLTLIPFTIRICSELIAHDTHTLEEMGLQCTPNWPDKEMMETLPKIVSNLSKVNKPTGFESWMIILTETKEIIGDIGFKGYNFIDNSCDLGYGLVTQHQQKGYAVEAAHALINWAFKHERLQKITATCLISNLPSAKLLQKLNMTLHSQDSTMLHWEISKENYRLNSQNNAL